MITIRHYDRDGTTDDVSVTDPARLKSMLAVSGVNWINIEMDDVDRENVNDLMDLFDLDDQLRHSIDEMIMAASDSAANRALPKFDTVRKSALFRLNMLYFDSSRLAATSFNEEDIGREQICLVGIGNTLISFQQGNIEGDILDPARRAIAKNQYQIREHGINHLFYLILDIILDGYFKIVGALREQIDDLEEKSEDYADERTLMPEIMRLKKILRFLRRETIHLKWAFAEIPKHENSFSTDAATLIHYETIRGHINELLSYYENGIETLKDLIAISISLSGAQMERVMKTLTLISAIFVPLTFLAGIYGMNFEHMPELTWRYGYFIVLAVMTVIGVGTLLIFRRWF